MHNNIYTQSTNDIYSVVKLRHDNWEYMQQRVGLRLHVYQDDYQDIIESYIRQITQPDLWEIYRKKYAFHVQENLMRSIINKTSLFYAEPATREFVKGEDSQDENYNTLINEHIAGYWNSIDHVMSYASKIVQVAGVVLVRPYVYNIDSGKDKLSFMTLTPDLIEIIQNENDPSTIDGLRYRLFTNQDGISHKLGKDFIFAVTDDAMQKLSSGQVKEFGYVELDNNAITLQITGAEYKYKDSDGLPILPFAIMRISDMPNQFMNESTGHGLYADTLEATKNSILESWVIYNQSHKQIVIAGPGASKLGNTTIDSGVPIILGQSGGDEVKVTTLDLKTDPDNIRRKIDGLYEKHLKDRGWTLEEFKQSAQRQSAEAQNIQNKSKSIYNNLMINDVLRPAENQLAEVLRIVWNADASVLKIDTAAKFNISFSNPFVSNPYAHHAEKMDLINRNISSPVDYYRDLNTDVQSRGDAIAAIKRNADEKTEIQGFSEETQNLIDTIQPQTADNENENQETNDNG